MLQHKLIIDNYRTYSSIDIISLMDINRILNRNHITTSYPHHCHGDDQEQKHRAWVPGDPKDPKSGLPRTHCPKGYI